MKNSSIRYTLYFWRYCANCTPEVMQPRVIAAIYGQWRVGKETYDLINFPDIYSEARRKNSEHGHLNDQIY
jgi:hypothetical protein